MKTTTRRTLAVGLLVFAAACSEQPVAPDVEQVTPGTQDVKPGSATEAQLNDVLHDIFGPNRSEANALLAQVKAQATSDDSDGALQSAVELIKLSIAEIGDDPTAEQEELVQRLADLLGQYLGELAGGDVGLGVAFMAGEAIITTGLAEAKMVVPAFGVAETTIFTIELISGGCLATDLPQSDQCYRYTAIDAPGFDFVDGFPAIFGECIDPGFVEDSTVHLIRLHAQDVVDGNTIVVSLPPVQLPTGFLSCATAIVSIESPSGLFGLAHAGWQKLKGRIASMLSPQTLHADATVLALKKAYGGTKGSLTDVAGALPVQMAISAGNDQTGDIDSRTAIDPAVVVTNADGGFVAGATVHWEVTLGNGSVAFDEVVTGSDGIGSVAWTLGDAGTHAIQAFAHGIADPNETMLPDENWEGGPFTDADDFVELGTGRLQFTAEAIIPAGGELVVINDVHVFAGGASSAGNTKLINNLVSFFNEGRGSQTTVWFDRGRSSKCADFSGCTDIDLATMSGIITSASFTLDDNDSGSQNRYGDIADTVKVLFLWNPTVAFQKKEVLALESFMEEGGRIVLVGENKDFVGANGINAANRLFKDLKVTMRVNSDNVACGLSPTTTANIGGGDIMAGVSAAGGIIIDCASSMTPDGEERLFSEPLPGNKWLAAVAKDFTKTD